MLSALPTNFCIHLMAVTTKAGPFLWALRTKGVILSLPAGLSPEGSEHVGWRRGLDG